jgi:cytochrome c biogenesis protein CcmG, thiol:disulfide interchange protein DsbE
MSTKPKAGAKARPKASSGGSGANQPPKPPASSSRPSPAKKRSGRGAVVALGVAAVVVVIAIIAVIATRSDDASAGPQTYPVQVTGTPLPPMPSSASTPDPAIGQVAPTLTGQSLFDGAPMTIKPGGGTPQMVVFVAHWCPHCQREVPVLVQWMASGQKPADLQVSAVSTAYNESPENSPASAWLKGKNWPTPVMADSSDDAAANAYGLTAFPYLVVLGPDGTVKARTTGELTADQLTSFVNKALAS